MIKEEPDQGKRRSKRVLDDNNSLEPEKAKVNGLAAEEGRRSKSSPKLGEQDK